MRRRDFLLTLGITLVSASAYSFGQSIQSKTKPLDKVAVLYGTRYGATKDTAQWIAKGVGTQVDVLNIENIDLAEIVKKYDKFIIGSGIWIDGPHKRLVELLSTYTEQIEAKIVASFIVCGTTGEDEAGKQRIKGYSERLHEPLSVKPKIHRHFGGRLIIEKLNEKDRKLLDNFYNNVLKKEFKSWDRTRPKFAEKFGKTLHQIKHTES